MSRILHPLLGIPCPTVADLIARAESDAAAVLRLAVRLAAWRMDAQARALAIKAELEDAPWSRERERWAVPPSVLLPADLARALLVEHPYLLKDSIFAHEPANADDLEQARATWTRAARAEIEPPSDLPVLRAWGRRLALGLHTHPELRPSLRHLVSAALVPEWAELVDRYREGLITRSESIDRLYDALAVATDRGTLARPAVDPVPPDPYLDHHGGVAALEDALETGPGAVLVGALGSGRSALLRACQWRHRRGDGPASLRGWGFNVDRFYTAPTFQPHGESEHLELPPELSERCIFALVHQGIAAAIDPAAPLHRQWRAAIEQGVRMALDPAARVRLVLGLTSTEHRALLRVVPPLERLPLLHVPVLEGRDVIALWICQVFELERRAEGPIDLVQILWALSRRPASRRLDLTTLDDVISPAPPILRRFAKRRRGDPDARVPHRLRQALDRLELSLDDLHALIELEAQLLAP